MGHNGNGSCPGLFGITRRGFLAGAAGSLLAVDDTGLITREDAGGTTVSLGSLRSAPSGPTRLTVSPDGSSAWLLTRQGTRHEPQSRWQAIDPRGGALAREGLFLRAFDAVYAAARRKDR